MPGSRLWQKRFDFVVGRASERGSALLQVVLAAGITMIIALIVAELTVQTGKVQGYARAKLSLFELRTNLLVAIMNDATWVNTLADADNSAQTGARCLKGINGDTGAPINCFGQGGQLNVVDGTGTKLVKANAPSAGFSILGAPCAGFDAAAGNPLCPIHVEVRWEADCADPCVLRQPPIKISVNFQIRGYTPLTQINPSNLNFVLRR